MSPLDTIRKILGIHSRSPQDPILSLSLHLPTTPNQNIILDITQSAKIQTLALQPFSDPSSLRIPEGGYHLEPTDDTMIILIPATGKAALDAATAPLHIALFDKNALRITNPPQPDITLLITPNAGFETIANALQAGETPLLTVISGDDLNTEKTPEDAQNPDTNNSPENTTGPLPDEDTALRRQRRTRNSISNDDCLDDTLLTDPLLSPISPLSPFNPTNNAWADPDAREDMIRGLNSSPSDNTWANPDPDPDPDPDQDTDTDTDTDTAPPADLDETEKAAQWTQDSAAAFGSGSSEIPETPQDSAEPEEDATWTDNASAAFGSGSSENAPDTGTPDNTATWTDNATQAFGSGSSDGWSPSGGDYN